MTTDQHRVVEWGWAGGPIEGEVESGDAHVVTEYPGGALVAVIDGLGHGVEAAAAARAAAAVIERHAGAPLESVVDACHAALRGTRGAVMSLASLDVRARAITWLAVGNVEAILLRSDPTRGARESVTPRGGVVGYQLPPLRPATVALSAGDTLVMATDGIRSAFLDGLQAGDPPDRLARRIYARHARRSDDALVVAARLAEALP